MQACRYADMYGCMYGWMDAITNVMRNRAWLVGWFVPEQQKRIQKETKTEHTILTISKFLLEFF
jgi:hypothetical protein